MEEYTNEESFSNDMFFDEAYPMNEDAPYPDAVDMHINNEQRVEPPRFMNPTFSGAQPARSGGYNEAERVRNSFRTGSFWTLKKLPAQIEPGEISKQRKVQTSQNLVVRPDHAKLLSFSGPLSCRAEKYIGTEFNKPDLLRKLRVDEEKYRSDAFSRRVFTVPASQASHKGANFVSPDFGPGGAAPPDLLTRKPEERKFLFGPFYQNVPPVATEIPKSNAKGWVKSLYEQLAEDWAGLIFSIKLTAQEIVIKFPTKSQHLPAESALTKYMLRQATHGNPQKWGLSKRGDRWCVMEVPQSQHPDDNTSISQVLAAQVAAGEPMLTFSFYLPWETCGLRKVTQKASRVARDRARHDRDITTARELALEAAFLAESSPGSALGSVVGDTKSRRPTRNSVVSSGAVTDFMQQRNRNDSGVQQRKRSDSGVQQRGRSDSSLAKNDD